MLTDVRLPVPDQTIESLVAATWLRNPWPTWEEAAAIVFGSAKTKSRRLVHGGWREAYAALDGAGYSTPDELVAAHSYLPLFQPFMEVAIYERLRSALVEGQVARLSALSRSRVLAAGPVRFCPQCAAREIAKSGYAVAHRSNQISGVAACSEHGAGLVTLSAHERFTINLSEKGLHIPSPQHHSPQTQCTPSHADRDPKPAELRYARLVNAALSGEFAPSSLQIRQLAFSDRLDKRFQARQTPGSTLSRLIRGGHPASALSEADLEIPLTGSAVWPALVADGAAFAHHPVANLLVMSVLFDDVDDYNQAIATAASTVEHHVQAPVGLRLGTLRGGLNSALIKDYLRDISLADVALRHDVDLATAKSVLRQFPRLAHHRKSASFRRRRSCHRAAALTLKRSHPRAARQDLKNLANADYAWLSHHDREWLDSNFPLKRPLRESASLYDVNLDISTAASAATVVEQLAREGRDHFRRNWSLLMDCFGKEIQRQLRTGRLPIAATSLREREESKAQHRDRCLRRIREQVESGCLREARLWASELLLTNSGDRTVISRVLSSLLPDTLPLANVAGPEVAYASS
jgi:hypothetical protein